MQDSNLLGEQLKSSVHGCGVDTYMSEHQLAPGLVSLAEEELVCPGTAATSCIILMPSPFTSSSS